MNMTIVHFDRPSSPGAGGRNDVARGVVELQDVPFEELKRRYPPPEPRPRPSCTL
jgi:hypothetical protein